MYGGISLRSTQSVAGIYRRALAASSKSKTIQKDDLDTEAPMKKPFKPSEAMESHFRGGVLSTLPEKLLRKKHKTPESYYIAHIDGASQIAKMLNKHLPKEKPFVEVNTGPGLLMTELLARKVKYVKIFEPLSQMNPFLKDIQKQFNEDIPIYNGDFISAWRMSYQDKLDKGNRMQLFFHGLPHAPWSDETSICLFAPVGSLNFIKYLINSIVLQNFISSGITQLGRYEFYMVVPPPLYIHLTCTSSAGYMFYRSTSMLFQTLFTHDLLGKVMRKHFLPWQSDYDLSKRRKLSKLNAVDPEYLYLIKIEPRKDITDFVSMEDLPAYYYFVTQHCVSRKAMIIPKLEKWIPGCGPRLILSPPKINSPKSLPMTTPETELPYLTTACQTLSNTDYVDNLNIFTSFGDLTPTQMLTIFTQFRNCPEYEQSPFRAAMETFFLKLEPAEEHVDQLHMNRKSNKQIH